MTRLSGKPLNRIVLVVFACAGLALYLALGLYTDRHLMGLKPFAQAGFNDFAIYVRALTAALRGIDPYSVGGDSIGNHLQYPPTSLLFVELFAHFRFNVRVAAFALANIGFLLLMIFLLAHRYTLALRSVWWWFPLALGFAPFFELVYIGQLNMFSVIALVLMFYFESLNPLVSGIGLSVGIVVKLTPVAFIGYLTATRNVRAVAGAILGTLVFSALAILRYGYRPLFAYVDVFQGLVNRVSLAPVSQSLAAKLTYYGWFPAAEAASIQRWLLVYVALACIVSALLTLLLKEHEPLFIVTGLGMMLSPNVLWYHHYVLILPFLLVWMAWSKFNTPVLLWCVLGLCIVQIDRYVLTYGLLIHLFGHLSILGILAWQVSQLVTRTNARRILFRQSDHVAR